MFREVTIAALTITALGLGLHALVVRGRRQGGWTRVPGPFVRLARAASLGLVLASIGVMAVTGFYPRLVWNVALSGTLLMVHVAVGGVFAAALAACGVVWAWDHWDLSCPWGHKASFWLMLGSGTATTLAFLSSLFPLFGTDWQGLLVDVHRTSALVCLISTAVWGTLVVRRPDRVEGV